MSADNGLIIIDEDKPCGDFVLYEYHGDSLPSKVLGGSGVFEDVVRLAIEHMNEEIYEHGLTFDI